MARINQAQALHRVHAQDIQGPGFIRFTGPVYGRAYRGSVDEGAGTVTLRVKRMAGKAGPASVEWKIIETQGNPAVSGAQSGRLEWVDGDDADKTFTLPLIDDQLASPLNPLSNMPFYSSVRLALLPVDATPPNAVVSEANFHLTILDNDSPPVNVQLEALNKNGSGGGGGLGSWTLLALLLLAEGMRRRRMHGINYTSEERLTALRAPVEDQRESADHAAQVREMRHAAVAA